jgi:DNA-binding transcriptional LysR family regulator
MQLEALKMFCDVVREASFSRAAAEHKVTQSAASQIVAHLEDHLGVQLLKRSRPLKLTEPGKVFYEGCKRLVEQYDALETAVSRKKAQPVGHVHVAAIYSVGLGDMDQLVGRFQGQFPNVHVQVDYLHPDRVYERVRDGTADFGLVSFPRRRLPGLKSLPWREEEMVLVCQPRHRLAGYVFVEPQHLTGEKYVGFDKDLVIRREVDRYLRKRRVTVKVVKEFDNIENIKKAIEVSGGVALLPAPTLGREVQAGTLVAVRLHGPRFVRPLGVIQRRHHKLSPNAQRFLDLLRQPEVSADPGRAEAASSVDGKGPSARTHNSPSGRNGAARAATKDGLS